MNKSIQSTYVGIEQSFELLLKRQLYFNLFFLSVQLHLLPQYYIVFAILGCLSFVKILSNIRLGGQCFSRFFIVVLALYSIYTFYVVTNFNGNYSLNNILRYAYLPTGFLFYIAPLVLLRYANLCYLSILKKFVFKQTTLYIILLVIFISFDFMIGVNKSEMVNHFECLQLYLGGGLVFLLIFQDSFTIRQKTVIMFGVIITIFFAAFFARRTVLATYIIGICFYFIGKTLSTNNFLYKILLFIAFTTLLAIVYYLIIQYGETLFPTLAGRIQDDTRSGVELEVLYILEQPVNFLTGLGMNSYYYSEYIQEMRDGCETGYLNMMMKGGIIYLVLYYFLCIPAIIGLLLKRQKNIQMWHLGLYLILVLVVGNAASSTFSFSIRYIVFIYFILCLYNKKTKNYIYEI